MNMHEREIRREASNAMGVMLRQCEGEADMLDMPMYDEWDFMSHFEAEMFAGQELPTKYRYFICNGELYYFVVALDACNYCFAYSENGYAQGHWDEELDTTRGTGCQMCEFTGLHAEYFALPFFPDPDMPF